MKNEGDDPASIIVCCDGKAFVDFLRLISDTLLFLMGIYLFDSFDSFSTDARSKETKRRRLLESRIPVRSQTNFRKNTTTRNTTVGYDK